jgi:glycosyltransferase involved in cell wall biosynthesis
MAAGIPVVATRVGGNSELITESRGILIDPGDEQCLIAMIDLLLRDTPMRAALGRNAKRFAETNFTIAEMKQQHEALYIELLKNKTRQNPKPYARS